MEASGSVGSDSDQPPGQNTSKISNLIGTAIALFTLVLPLYVIASYSSSAPESLGTPPLKLAHRRRD